MADPEKAQVDNKEIEEVEEDGEMDDKVDSLTSELMRNPEVLAAMQSKLGNMVGTASGYIQSLPKVVKRRIKALKKLQLESCNIEAKFFQEVHALECKYASLYAPLYDKRGQVVKGAVEPTDDECDFPSDDDDDDDLASTLQEKVKDGVKIEEVDEQKENPSGIPEFWLTIFKNVEMTADMIQTRDEPIMKHLTDVKVVFSDKDPMGFKLEFYFSENEFFTNSVLTKEYEMKCNPDSEDPFSFEGPEIYKCSGSTIDWKKDQDVTQTVMKKKQKHKSSGSFRTVTKTVQADSFFNFFKPPAIPEDDSSIDEETQTLLSADFEIGHFIRERIVPRAVLYFTGEALQDDSDYEDEEDDEEEEEEEEDGEENDPDYKPKGGKGQPPECQQQ